MIFETHCHLDDKRFDVDREVVIDRMREAGVCALLNVGYDLASSVRSVQLAEEYPEIYACVGIHPHDAKDVSEDVWLKIEELAQSPKVVALGEMGLDYYRDLSPRMVQQEVFMRQLDMANRLRLPVVVHDREAHQDVIKTLQSVVPKSGGVLHCFSGSWETAKVALKLGFYISFAGPITYKNAVNLHEVAAKVPLERLLVETDSPYLPPEPFRGRRNEPAFVKQVVQKIAEIRKMEIEELSNCVTLNAKNLFFDN